MIPQVTQERRKLLTDFERLKKHYEQYEPTIADLRHRYEVLMKEKMLMRLERDRLQSKAETLQEQLDALSKQVGGNALWKDSATRCRSRSAGFARICCGSSR